jgi:CHAT domain-containing protein
VIQPTGKIEFRQVDLTSLDTSLKDLVASSRHSMGVGGRGLAAVPSQDEATQSVGLQQLHQLLIEPIAQFLPKDPEQHVIFIPHQSLFLVPFAALRDTSGKYLIEKHTLVTAPSIQVLQLTEQQRRAASGKGLLVVGNPTMPSITTETGKLQQLPELPGAQVEAIEIARILNTQPLIGNQATKTSVMQQMLSADIIHLATHGLLEDFTGLGVPGAIVLAPDPPLSSVGKGGTHSLGLINGLLTSSEILTMKLKAQLVVLSACDTGRGTITGDGVIGLSRSLISAGVPSVIVSLWSVPDAPTAELMSEFYRQLQQTPDKAHALRQAMLATMKQHPKPKDWAAFTLIGEAN